MRNNQRIIITIPISKTLSDDGLNSTLSIALTETRKMTNFESFQRRVSLEIMNGANPKAFFRSLVFL